MKAKLFQRSFAFFFRWLCGVKWLCIFARRPIFPTDFHLSEKQNDMDFKEIQELVKLVSKLGLAEVSIKEGEFKITVRGVAGDASAQVSHAPVAMAAAAPQAAPPAAASAEVPAAAASAPAESASNLVAVKSPMVGTFYRSSSPDKPAFAKVGDVIVKGQAVCIIEAMKLFNEIESEVKGKIVKVMVEDASPVEYDQVLFLVDPS